MDTSICNTVHIIIWPPFATTTTTIVFIATLSHMVQSCHGANRRSLADQGARWDRISDRCDNGDLEAQTIIQRSKNGARRGSTPLLLQGMEAYDRVVRWSIAAALAWTSVSVVHCSNIGMDQWFGGPLLQHWHGPVIRWSIAPALV